MPEELPVGFIDVGIINAVLTIHRKVQDSAEWAIGGDAADAMRGAKIEPDHLEIITDAAGATKIYEAMKGEYNPTPVGVTERRVSREALINGTTYPVYTRSNYTEFKIGKVTVKVHGDLQYKVGEWRWGDVLEFWPEPLQPRRDDGLDSSVDSEAPDIRQPQLDRQGRRDKRGHREDDGASRICRRTIIVVFFSLAAFSLSPFLVHPVRLAG